MSPKYEINVVSRWMIIISSREQSWGNHMKLTSSHAKEVEIIGGKDGSERSVKMRKLYTPVKTEQHPANMNSLNGSESRNQTYRENFGVLRRPSSVIERVCQSPETELPSGPTSNLC